MRKIILMTAFCVAGSFINIAVIRLCFIAGIPLYLDTIMTISITLTGGFFWGALCGMLTNLIHHTFWGWGWEGYLFILCDIATAFVTWLFMRLFPGELNLSVKLNKTRSAPSGIVYKSSLFSMVMDRLIVLIILSFALCLAMSFLGGLIAYIILTISSSYNFEGSGITALFRSSMFKGRTPVIVSEIVSRVPVNIVDRLISAFCGFAIALGLTKVLTAKTPILRYFSREKI